MSKQSILARYHNRVANAGKVYHEEVKAINEEASAKRHEKWGEYRRARRDAKTWKNREMDRLQGVMIKEEVPVA